MREAVGPCCMLVDRVVWKVVDAGGGTGRQREKRSRPGLGAASVGCGSVTDRCSRKLRSAIMARVKAANTGPELAVRRVVHGLGYRFRLHRRDLPGTPDLVLPKHRAVVFVHGCFWHQHDCRRGRPPATNEEYWGPKLKRNVERDASARMALRRMGWRVLTIWECEIGASGFRERVERFLRNRDDARDEHGGRA